MNASTVLAPPAVEAAIKKEPLLWRMWGWMSAYLPLLLMVALALGTWWLVKNTPLAGDSPTGAPPRHEPDYEMRNFSVQRFTAQGPLRARIEGEVMRHYPDTDTVEIDQVRLRSIGTDGRVTLATARHAIANGAGTEVQLLGGAEVTSEATATDEAMTFRGEFLHAFLDTESVRSHLPVVVTKGATEVRADSLNYSHLDRVIQFTGRVHATFSPRPTP